MAIKKMGVILVCLAASLASCSHQEVLIQKLRDKDQAVRSEAAASLVEIGEAALPALTDTLKDKEMDGLARVYAASALGAIGNADAIGPLLAVLKDEGEDPLVRQFSA